MRKTAFVTGGTGFIGTNLIELLLAEGWQVTALYRRHSTRTGLNLPNIRWVKGSITDRSSLQQAIPPHTSTVFHLAGDTNLWAKQNERQTTINIQGTENMVHAAAEKEVPVFVHTSSVAAWGNISGTVTEETTQLGQKSWINYERTKWAGEQKALEGLIRGMKVVILNPANVIGPHDKKNWGRLFLALRDHKLPFIADGCVSIAHVKEVVRAHVTAARNGKSGERYILAGAHHLFSDFVRSINNISRAENMPPVIPSSLFRAYAYLSSGLSSVSNREPTLTPELAHLMTRTNVRYMSDKAKAELNYTIPPMQKSVKDCYRWLKSENIL